MSKPAMPEKGAYKVVDDVFLYTSKRGLEFVIDLDFPAEVMKAALDGDKPEEEQFNVVAKWLGEDIQAAYEKLGALERARFMRTFFNAFSEAAQLPLGESLGSSPS